MWCATFPTKARKSDAGQVRNLVSTLAVFALFALFACAACGPTVNSKPANETRPAVSARPTPAASSEPELSPRAEEITEEWSSYFTVSDHSIASRSFDEHGYELKAQYPQLSSSKAEVRRFNRWIKNKVLGYANEFERLADAEQRRKHKRPPYLWGLDLVYVVYYSNERIVSLRLTHVVMEKGQMHPIAYYETLNYDLKRGRQLRAKDVFKRGYLKRFSDYSRKRLIARHDETMEEWISRGTRPNLDNFANWNLVPGGVLLSFEDYQVGPHSTGQPEFVIPFSELRGTLRPVVEKLLLPK